MPIRKAKICQNLYTNPAQKVFLQIRVLIRISTIPFNCVYSCSGGGLLFASVNENKNHSEAKFLTSIYENNRLTASLLQFSEKQPFHAKLRSPALAPRTLGAHAAVCVFFFRLLFYSCLY